MQKKWSEVEGWLTASEASLLQRLAKGKKVLEVGTWKGKSALAMSETAEHVLCVDHFKGDDYAGKADTYLEWRFNTRDTPNISLLCGPCMTMIPLLDLSRFGLIYYDADHTYDATIQALWLVALKHRNTSFAIHDYEPGNDVWKGVVAAVAEFAAYLNRFVQVVDRLAFFPVDSTYVQN